MAVVGAEITHVNIQGDAANLRPGMNGEVGFGQNNRARYPRRFASSIGKLVEKPPDHGQAVAATGIDAMMFQRRSIQQEGGCAGAVVQVGDQVKSLHVANSMVFHVER